MQFVFVSLLLATTVLQLQ